MMLGLSAALPCTAALKAPFYEGALWPSGASSPGLWIDGPSYPAACYQDSAGTTALSTVGTVLDSSNPVGLVLDRKGNLALGSEIVTNGGFDTSSGWSSNAGVSISGGVATATSATGYFYRTGVSITAGKTYEVSFDVSGYSGTGTARGYIQASPVFGTALSGNGRYTHRLTATTTNANSEVGINMPAAEFTGVIDNFSIKEIPGIHLSQSTSAARPVASGRVNLLERTQDIDNAYWTKGGASVSPNIVTAPDGTTTADTLTESATTAYHYANRAGAGSFSWTPNTTYTLAISAKYNGRRYLRLMIYDGISTPNQTVFDIQNGVLGTFTSGTLTRTIVSQGDGWYRCTITATTGATISTGSVDIALQSTDASDAYAGDGVSGLHVWGADLRVANTGVGLPAYQRVGAASDYTATGFPVYLKLDGTDDGLAGAGTFTSSMDCLIAIRRDSTANTVVGLYNAVADATKYFGMAESGSSSGCVGSGAGTPTVWVDGVQLTGGTAVTRGTLHTALTAGAWHIVEFRGLDLSTWTAVGHGLYTSYVRNGALGKLLVFASGQDTNRDKARKRMADYFGVTLP